MGEEGLDGGPGPIPDRDSRVRLVARSVTTWVGELVDLGGRNTLLYFRDLKQGTLDLGPASPANDVAVEGLLAGRTLRLSDLFDAASRSPAARRCRTVKAKADENFQERGLQTLFLAWGMATWNNPTTTATPAAPVLMRQAALAPRGGAGEDFDLKLPGEWEINPTLLHLLRTDHEIELAATDLLAVFDEDAEVPNASAVFEHLGKSCAGLSGFGVTPRVVLANFSYAKLPMVLDLENAIDMLVASELICAVAGDEVARDAVRARHPDVAMSEPDVVPPRDEYLVLDADASQSYAINAAVGGADLIIDGPPGTGKSQTIANLIATLAARGQRILFVAEKRAAIDAVLGRLNRVGLGDLVLDLHEGAGPKRKLAADLARCLAAASNLPRPDMAAAQEGLVRRREILAGHAEALHRRRAPWGVSVYDARARLFAIPPTASSPCRLRGDILTHLGDAEFREAQGDLERFLGLGGPALSKESSPWGGAFVDSAIATSETAQLALEVASTLVGQTLPTASSRFARALNECGLAPPDTVEGWAQVLVLLDEVAAILAAFDPSIFEAPLADLSAALALGDRGPLGQLGSRIVSATYRKAHKAAMGLRKGDKPRGHDLHAAVERAAALSAYWHQVASDGGTPRLPLDLDGLKAIHRQLSLELQTLGAWTARPHMDSCTLLELNEYLSALVADTRTLSKLPELTRLRSRVQGMGLGPLLTEIGARAINVDWALACLEHVWLSSILEAVSIVDARVGAFDGHAHTRTVAEYQSADRSHIETAALRVRRAVAEHATAVRDNFPKESDVIEHQARLKRGHLPVRQLFQAAPHVLGAIKPCWAMSPLVVSQLLPAQRLFDVVIFDEASQVTPADAVGALMRAERAIVAGDPRQLPPTSFFAASSGGGEDDEDAEAEMYSAAGTRNMESVLDVMSALLPPPKGTRTLSWHYRSKDERLIAFSNAQPDLYNWALTTFPGVGGSDCISHELVPFQSGRAGQEDSSAAEVVRVVQLVAEHAANRPDESLGVIAMGIRHANRVDEALRRARVDDADLDSFLSGSASTQALREPFFVKNLERVQGDERDAILMTIGYGKTTDGRMLYRFGPINIEGGQRRLNVAVTRARSRMTVVSSFSSADMDPNKLRSEGAQMLGRYIAYAESKGSDLGNAARNKVELNPFERDIAEKLGAAGIPLVAQYGCSGYWIDFAAQHPSRAGQMVLAIECDGARYHSSATARDRDRLRQEHLERLGWSFHRIWSQDWFHHREAEVVRAVAAYRVAVAAVDAGEGGYKAPRGSGADQVSTPALDPAGPSARSGPCPVAVGRSNIDAFSQAELVAVVHWVESDTLLRTEEELFDATMAVIGFSRRGSKITGAIKAAIALARDPTYPASPKLFEQTRDSRASLTRANGLGGPSNREPPLRHLR